MQRTLIMHDHAAVLAGMHIRLAAPATLGFAMQTALCISLHGIEIFHPVGMAARI